MKHRPHMKICGSIWIICFHSPVRFHSTTNPLLAIDGLVS